MEFEEYLNETHTMLFPGLVGDRKRHFEHWVSNLSSTDYIKYANEALKRAELQRSERIHENINRL